MFNPGVSIEVRGDMMPHANRRTWPTDVRAMWFGVVGGLIEGIGRFPGLHVVVLSGFHVLDFAFGH